jgi:hypothetical protein
MAVTNRLPVSTNTQIPKYALTCVGITIPACLLASFVGLRAQDPAGKGNAPDVPSRQDIARLGKVVEAQAFVLQGANGKVRGILAADEKGQSGLELFDESGRSRMRAAVDHGGDSSLLMQSRDGRTSCQLVVSGDESAVLLLGVKGKRPHDLMLFVDGFDSKVALFSRGTPILDITDLEGEPMINLRDGRGNRSIEISSDDQGRPRIRLQERDELTPNVPGARKR